MLNHQQRNEQLIKDILFLERVFLLEIEEVDRSSVEQKVEALSTKSDRRSILKLGLLFIYAVLITLLSPLPDSLEEANDEVVVNELRSKAEVKRQMAEGLLFGRSLYYMRTSPLYQTLSVTSVTRTWGNSRQRQLLKDGACILKGIRKEGNLTLLPPAICPLPSKAEALVEAQKIEQLQLLETELNQARLKRQSLESQIAKYRERQSPSLPQTREALSTSNDEIPVASEVKETGQAADLVLEQLPPLPVPEVPPSTSNAEIPIRQVVEDIEDESLSSPIEPEPQLQIAPESEVETPEVTVTEEIELMGGWLGEANVVYHSSISDPSEAEEQLNSSVSDNIQQTEHSLLADEDLRQYLTSTPLSSEPKSSPVSVSVESEPRAEVNDQIEAELPEVTVTEALETESTSPTEERPLFADEDLRQYLTSTPLSSEPKSVPASVSVESELRAEVNDQIEAELPEVTVTEELETELASPTEERPLFADEDLKKYLTSTPLFADDILKQRLKMSNE